jgi:hypothetical protein
LLRGLALIGDRIAKILYNTDTAQLVKDKVKGDRVTNVHAWKIVRQM